MDEAAQRGYRVPEPRLAPHHQEQAISWESPSCGHCASLGHRPVGGSYVRNGFESMKPSPSRLTGVAKMCGSSTIIEGTPRIHIKEAKYGLAFDQFSSQDFRAIKALQALKLLAYNLLLLYKQEALKPECANGEGRLRRRLFLLPGILVRHAPVEYSPTRICSAVIYTGVSSGNVVIPKME